MLEILSTFRRRFGVIENGIAGDQGGGIAIGDEIERVGWNWVLIAGVPALEFRKRVEWPPVAVLVSSPTEEGERSWKCACESVPSPGVLPLSRSPWRRETALEAGDVAAGSLSDTWPSSWSRPKGAVSATEWVFARTDHSAALVAAGA